MRFSAVDTTEAFLPQPISQRVRPLAEKADQILSGGGDVARTQRASLAAFLIRIASAVVAFVSQIAFARMMGIEAYGIFVLVWITMVIIGSLSCLGFQTVVIRFVPQYREMGDLKHMRGILLASRLAVLLASTLAAAIVMSVTWFAREWIEPYYVLPFIIGALCLPMISLGDTLDGTARAQGWTIRALTPSYLMRPILILLLMIGAYLLGFEIDAVLGLQCAAIASYLTTIGQLLLITRDVDATIPRGKRAYSMMHWTKVALPIFLVEGFFFLLINADTLMVGLLMTPADVAIYFATIKTLALVHFVFFAVKAGIAHRFAALLADGENSALHDMALRSVTWTFWPSLLMGAVLLAVAPLMLAMFGAEYQQGYPLLFVLVSGVILRAAIGPAESLLNMTGHQNACAAVFGSVLVINIGLNAVLIPWIGLYGAASATFLATLLEVFALYQLVYRRIGVRMSILTARNMAAV
ncbi:MAG: lipopolysaccharide biosynthesis protein [Pseudomonadota bacterium]